MTKFRTLRWRKWVNNSLIFLAPLGIMYLLNVQNNINSNGYQITDLYLDEKMVGAMMLYVINVALDFLKKYISAK